MQPLIIGDLKIEVPIIQGGMAVGISLAGLASAVAKQGGVGIIATAGIGNEEGDLYKDFVAASLRGLRKEIRKARELTEGKGVLGVNIMVALGLFDEMVQTSIDEGIDIIFSGAGLPLNLPKFLTPNCKTKLVPIVSSGRAAKIICTKWDRQYNYAPDLVVVEGPLAGGHLGFNLEELSRIDDYKLEKLVVDTIREVKPYEEKYNKKIPVIAGGGVYTGEDIVKFLNLGCAGVQMATRFVATFECDADEKFKQAFVDAKKEDLIFIKSPVGLPGRAIRNKFLNDVEEGKKVPIKCPYKCIKTCTPQESPYCIAFALVNAQKGHLNGGFVFAGANAYRVDKIVSVKELMDSLIKEVNECES